MPKVPSLSAEQKLTLFDSTSSLASIGYWSLDVTTGSVWWSDEIYRIHGYEPGEITPDLETGINAYHPDDRAIVEREVQHSQETGEAFNFSLRIVRPNGETRFVRSLGLCEADDKGVVSHIYGLFVDETETKRQHQDIVRERLRLEMAAEAADFGVWDINIATGTGTWDAKMYAMFGIPEDTAINYRSWVSLVHPEDKKHIVDSMNHSLLEGAPLDASYRIVRPDGTVTHTRAKGMLIESEYLGEGKRLLGINYDETDWHELQDKMNAAREKEETANRMKSDFLAKMSHEIRTPMNGLIGMLDQVASDPLTGEQEKRIHLALDSARNLLSILNDTLDFTKLEAGHTSLETIDFAPANLMAEIAGLFQPSAEAKGLTLRVDCAPDLPAVLNADAGKIRQILLNLLGNAVKFTEAGSVTLAASCAPSDHGAQNAELLIISVTDTGIGIPKSAMDNLFDHFIQADNSISRQYGGTGLGLAISKGFADLMDAKLTVDSQQGRGSVFTLCIPVTPGIAPEAEPQGGTQPDQPVPVNVLPPSDAKILVVEDHPINREVMAGYLMKFGLTADYAEDGAIGIEKAQQTAYDLILMDIQMPVIDGIAATERLRAEPGPCQRVPIVAVTANAMVEDKAKYMSVGMDDYISKPIDMDRFEVMLRKFLTLSEPESTAPTDTQSSVSCAADQALDDLLAKLA